jgi:hypothetical protein
MLHRYRTDLRCGACVAKVRPLLDAAFDVRRWEADTGRSPVTLSVEGDNLTAERVGALIGPAGYHVLGEEGAPPPTPLAVLDAAPRPAAETEKPASYYPLLLILVYLLGAVALAEVAAGPFDPMRAMGRFMAGFFLVFSFFKLLDLRAFADSYSSYDVIAAKWYGYGFVYPLIELGLGAAYLANVAPVATNLITLVVMGVSTVGVVKTLAARRKVRCACLGTVFNLPMSAVTLVEDTLMVAMSAVMLVWLL